MFRRFIFAGLSLLLVSAASAQSPIEGLLQDLAETEAQRAIARVVENICPSGQISDERLQSRCNEIVGEAFRQDDVEGIREALQALAPEENLVVGSSLVDTAVAQVDAVQQRLATIRAGGGGGGGANFALNFSGWQNPNGRSASPLTSGLFPSWGSPAPEMNQGSNQGGGFEMDRRLGFFANVTSSSVDRDASALIAGFEGDQTGVTAGIDYLINSRFVLGGALGYEENDSDLDQAGGSVESESLTFSAQASWFGDKSFWFEVIAGFGTTDVDQSRAIRYSMGGIVVNGTAVGDTKSNQTFASIATGWDLSPGAFSISPEIRFDFLDASVDGFSETVVGDDLGAGLGITFGDQDFTSFTGQVGVQVGYNFSTSFGVVIPQLNAAYISEFDDSADTVTGRFVGDSGRELYALNTDEADSSYGRLGLGAVFVFGEGKSFYFFYDQLVAYENLDVQTFNIGFRLGG